MSAIDERIVDMQFNNKQFETGVKDTLSSLDNLKTGLSGIDDAGKKFSLAGIAEGVSTIADKFSALGIIGITVLQNITNAAIDAGKKLISALTIDPLMDGFREYELQMNAVKVMMANLGDKSDMAQINEALDDLNAYADKTIYNFGDMTDAVGKFTAAGVGLEESTNAIKGLANVAAGAGVSAEKMKGAYIQVSQALQAGVFRLQDWRSMETAGLGNEEFRNRLLANAQAIDNYSIGSQNFRESLKDNWLTTEVFLATMNDATDETGEWGKRLYAAATEITTFSQMMGTLKESIGSGWGSSFKIIIGDFEEAKKLWTDVSNVLDDLVGSFADARNAALRFWKENGGRDTLIKAISNSFKGLQEVMSPISKAWSEIFPPITGQRLIEISNSLLDLSEKFKLSEQTSANLERTFKGLFAAFDLVGMGISTVFQIAGKLLGVLMPVGDGILGLTAGLGDFIVNLRDSAIDGNTFSKAVEKIGLALDKVQEVVQKAVDGVKIAITKLKEYFQEFGGINLGPLTTFGKEVEGAFKPFTFIASLFTRAWDGIVAAFKWAAPIVGPIAVKIGQAFSDFGKKIGEAVKSGDLKSLLDLVNTGLLGSLIFGIQKFIDSMTNITKGAGGFLEGLTTILDGVRGSLEAYQSKLKAQALLTIAGAIALLAGALLVLSTIDAADMASSLAAITVLFIELSATLLVLSKNMGTIKMGAVAGQMLLISGAILILSFAMKNIAELNPEQITQGLIAIGIMMAEIAAFTKLVKIEKLTGAGIAMIAMGAAIQIMSNALRILGVMKPEEISKGLIALGGILLEVGLFTNIIKPEKLVSAGIAMIAMGAAIQIIGNAVQNLGTMKWEEIGKGLTVVGGILTGLAVFTQLINPAKILTTGIAMIAMGAAIQIIGNAVQNLGTMKWEEIGKGLITLGGALLIMAVSVNAMKGSLGGAAAMLVMSAAIMMLVPAIKILGSMDLMEIGKALLALVGVFAVIGAAGLVLGPLTPVILGLAAAIAILGVGVLAIGAGLLLFSAGLAALAISGTAGVGALVIAVTSIISLIPMAIGALGEGLLMFIQVIADGTPLIMEALTAIVVGLIQVLIDLAPKLVEAIFVFLEKMLDTFVKYIPKLVDVGLKLLLGILEGISKNIRQVVVTALLVMEEFLKGLAEGIPEMASAGADVIIAFVRAIGEETPRIIDAGFKMIIDFVNGLATAIRENTGPLIASFGNLASSMIDGLINGLFAGIKSAVDAVKNLGSSIIDGFKGVLGIASPSKEFKNASLEIGNGIVAGLKSSEPKTLKSILQLGTVIKKGFESTNIPKIFKDYGVTTAEEFIAGIQSMSTSIKKSIESVFLLKEDPAAMKNMTKAQQEAYKVTLQENQRVVQTMTDAVDEAFKTIEDRIVSYTETANNRMSKLSTTSEVTVAEMISNLKHNQAAISEWANGLAKLTERGLNEGLLEELRKAGPASAGEVKALVAASDTEIQQLNTVMAKAGQVATQALATSVGQGSTLMVEPGQNIVDALAKGLVSSNSLNESMALIITNAKTIGLNNFNVAEFENIGKNVPDGISQGISSNSSGVTTAIDKVGTSAGVSANNAGKNIVSEAEKGLQTNSDTFGKAGTKYGTDFSTALTNTQTLAHDAGKNLITSAGTGLKTSATIFGQTGVRYGLDFSNGLTNTKEIASNAGKIIGDQAELGLKTNAMTFVQIGNKYGEDFSTALITSQTKANQSGLMLAKSAAEGIKSLVSEFEAAGVSSAEGFLKGLESMVKKAAEAASKLARAAKEAIEDELDIQSPSKELYSDGEYAGLGFVNGLLSMIDNTATAGRKIGSTALNNIKDAISNISNIIDEDLDLAPVITPVLDLTDIQNGSDSISRILSGSPTTTPIANNINRIASQMSGNDILESTTSQTSDKAPKYEFTQINNSPKALNRLELYRQSKNLFAQLKGV